MKQLLHLHNCDSGTAELYMLITGIAYKRKGAEILADELAQDAVSGSMKDSYLSGTDHQCVIHKIRDGL